MQHKQFFFCVTRVRNAFTHNKKESLFEAKQLFLLSVGLALLLKLNLTKSNLGLTLVQRSHELYTI